MIQQQQFETQPNAAVSAYDRHPELQRYLDALEKPLSSQGEAECQEWRQEAETHLHSLILAHQELGSTYDEAVVAALKQFGDTEQVGQQMARELQRQRMGAWGRDLAYFYEPITFGFVAEFALMMLYLSLKFHIFTTQSLPGIESALRCGALLLFVIIPLSAGWRFRLMRRFQEHLPFMVPRFTLNARTQAAPQWFLILFFVLIGTCCGEWSLLSFVEITRTNGGSAMLLTSLLILSGLLWLPLARLGEHLATSRIRSVVRKLGTEATP